MTSRRASFGFTLVELSIVLVIIALVTSMSVFALMGTLDSAKKAATEKRMDAIEKALLNFRLANNRLPCPGDATLASSNVNYGLEANNNLGGSPAVPGICVSGTITPNFLSGQTNATPPSSGANGVPVVEGGIPTRTLNLPDNYMFDGWGRRFTYAVDGRLTTAFSFNIYPPHVPFDVPSFLGGIWVTDANHKLRTAHASYVLLSYGKNGHGAYINSNTPFSAGSTNVNEQINCHCDSTANRSGNYVNVIGVGQTGYSAAYVQQDNQEDPTGGTNGFDDILRYKERGELLSYDDTYNFGPGFFHSTVPGYEGPPLLLGFSGVTPNVMATLPWCAPYYNNSEAYCGYQTADSPPGTIPSSWLGVEPSKGQNILGLGFTPNNTNIFVYSNDAINGNCALYALNGRSISTTPTAGGFPGNCPAYNSSNIVTMANNGSLAIASNSGSTGIRLWDWSGSKYNDVTSLSPSLISTGINPVVVFSAHAEYLFLYTAAMQGLIYHRGYNGGYYVSATPLQLTNGIANALSAAAFSPDEKYLAATELNTNIIWVWTLNGNDAGDPFNGIANLPPVFNPNSFPGPTNGSQGYYATPPNGSLGKAAITFSGDGQYLAAIADGVFSGSASNNLVVYKVDGPIPTLTPVTISNPYGEGISASGIAITSVAFTPDSNYLAVGTNFGAMMFQRISTLNYMQVITVPPYWGNHTLQNVTALNFAH